MERPGHCSLLRPILPDRTACKVMGSVAIVALWAGRRSEQNGKAVGSCVREDARLQARMPGLSMGPV